MPYVIIYMDWTSIFMEYYNVIYANESRWQKGENSLNKNFWLCGVHVYEITHCVGASCTLVKSLACWENILKARKKSSNLHETSIEVKFILQSTALASLPGVGQFQEQIHSLDLHPRRCSQTQQDL